MWVYGDQSRRVAPAELLAEVEADVCAGDALSALIGLGQLAQGVADLERDARGADARSPLSDALMLAATELAHHLLSAGSAPAGMFLGVLMPGLAGLPELEVRTPEGYAFYALHPLLYAAAARDLPPGDWRVIGLRSIGTSLAAVAAAALDAPPPITVRPSGHPFARELALAPELEAELRAHPGDFLIVDEGPGLSGSSFAGTADALERLGAPADRIAFLPGHGGDLGAQAAPAAVARWRTALRPVGDFESVVRPRLLQAAEALVGPALAPVQDISGGAWRALPGDEDAIPPAYPAQERRKLLLRSASGSWLLKFAGLGRIGARKLARARRLHAAGWCAEPVGLAEGFLVERWRDDAGAAPATGAPPGLGDYLALRSSAPAEAGASAETLWAMTRANAVEALGEAAGEALDQLCPDLPRLEAITRRVQTDGRLHRWEWRLTPDRRWLKTDALDHCEAHDLVGAQDIAWDLAGAELELGVGPEEAERIRRTLDVEPELLALHRLAYPAFQLGLWTLAAEGAGGARDRARLQDQAGRYAHALATRLHVDPRSRRD